MTKYSHFHGTLIYNIQFDMILGPIAREAKSHWTADFRAWLNATTNRKWHNGIPKGAATGNFIELYFLFHVCLKSHLIY